MIEWNFQGKNILQELFSSHCVWHSSIPLVFKKSDGKRIWRRSETTSNATIHEASVKKGHCFRLISGKRIGKKWGNGASGTSSFQHKITPSITFQINTNQSQTIFTFSPTQLQLSPIFLRQPQHIKLTLTPSTTFPTFPHLLPFNATFLPPSFPPKTSRKRGQVFPSFCISFQSLYVPN